MCSSLFGGTKAVLRGESLAFCPLIPPEFYPQKGPRGMILSPGSPGYCLHTGLRASDCKVQYGSGWLTGWSQAYLYLEITLCWCIVES